MRRKQAAAFVLAAGALCGCTTLENNIWGMRYGPSPLLVAETVQNDVERQTRVVAAIVAGARGISLDPATGIPIEQILPPPGAQHPREAWYQVILTGFNTIDDACMSYIDALWIMDRQKNRNSTILHAGGAVGAALLSAQVTPQTAAALLVLSQAFGFAGILNNAIFETYLYTQSPSMIKRIVRKTTTKYRTVFATNVGVTDDEVVYPVASSGAAYHHLREYLNLCLPPTIQAQIEERLNGAKAIPEGSDDDVPLPKAKTRGTSRSLLSGGAPRAIVPTRRVIPTTSITLE